jgi:hypothetical protein
MCRFYGEREGGERNLRCSCLEVYTACTDCARVETVKFVEFDDT